MQVQPTQSAKYIKAYTGVKSARPGLPVRQCHRPTGSFKFDNTSPQVLINWLFPCGR
jgi:hypothetical protein